MQERKNGLSSNIQILMSKEATCFLETDNESLILSQDKTNKLN